MELLDFLMECAKIERTIEISRQFLTKFPTFHPYQAFKQIDQLNDGYITAQTIQVFLHRFGYLHTLKECGILFYKPEFKYVDFLRFLLPTNQLLRDYISHSDQQSYQSNECLKEIAKHISLEIVLMNNLLPPQSIDKLTDGTREDIESLFKKERLFVYQDEIDAMVKRLDFYGDGQIDLLLLKNWVLVLNKQTKNKQENQSCSAFVTPKKQIQVQNSIKTTDKKESLKKTARFMNVSPQKRNLMQRQKSKKKVATPQTQKQGVRGKVTSKKQEGESEKKKIIEVQTNKKTANTQSKIKSKQPQEIIEYLMDKEIKIEKIKKQLALQKDFNALDAFRTLDVYSKGSIGKEEIDTLLNQKAGQSMHIFNRFNSDQLTYHDFLILLQPQSANFAEILNTRQPSEDGYKKKMSELFSNQTIELLIELLTLLQLIPVKLNADIQLFNKIDGITRDNFIGVSDLQQYLYESGLRYTHHEAMLLINAYDKDKDGRLSLQEFLDI
ncbi:unnamed protein product (macronuclear) [Paramecium tetraurelia]|uniref:EF-hand domain-containing protein n=1 Tax=Paramecium tetraurelia TaxID=5888 RepID=A0CXU3_PARTE|nr:uncharacterized protein GSPATT00011242001 [Paramecium tetraurelia]CAK75610.1 unnamed protein product [Paramecium tetraurelia]|eukprot:XP_001443007.1 hypothetical protein (macronuclear) [Paramecium tetraurelia strain d4-2]